MELIKRLGHVMRMDKEGAASKIWEQKLEERDEIREWIE